MTDRTTSRVIPRPGPNDSIPVLTEVVEFDEELDGLADAEMNAAQASAQPDEAPVVEERLADAPRAAEQVLDELLIDEQADYDAEPVDDVGEQDAPASMVDAAAAAEDMRAVRAELLGRVMMRFRTEWPQLVHAQTEAALQERLAPLAMQIASELTRSLEARLMEWLDATLEEIERDPLDGSGQGGGEAGR